MTNPPVPATPLDVEACVRLLDDLILMLAPHDAQSIADADQLRALKAALPGMGKDREENEHLQEIATTGLAWLEDLRPVLHVGGTYGNAMCDEFTSPTDLHVKALLRFSAYLEETSADG